MTYDTSGREDVFERLREGDPLDGDAGMGPAAASEMRRAVLRARPTPAPFRFRLPIAAAGALASVLMLAGIVYWTLHTARPAGPPLDSRVSTPAAGAASRNERHTRTIHFVTAGGTRVIWTLDSDFDV